MKKLSQFQLDALAKTVAPPETMTANEITLSKVIAIRGQVLIAAAQLDRIIDQIRHGEITPERATKEVFEEIIKIASVK